MFSGEFLKGTLALASSNTVAQIIPFLVAPFLTRIYSPEEFGFLASLVSIAALLSVLCSAKFELALVIEPDPIERDKLLAMCLYLLQVFIAILTLATVLVFAVDYIIDGELAIDWRYSLLPLAVLLLGLANILFNFVNAEKEFKRLAVSAIFYSTINNAAALILFTVSSVGLVVGELIGRIASLVYLKRNVFNIPRKLFDHSAIQQNIPLLRKYRKFPIYTIPSEMMDVYTKQVPVYVLGFFNMMGPLGLYALTDKVLNKPLSIVGRAVSVTFRVKAASDYAERGNCRPILLKTLLMLITLSIFPFSTIYIYAEGIFAVVFGEEWRTAGTFAQILIPLFFIQFVTSPLTYVFHIAGKQEVDMYLHIFMAISLSACFIYGFNDDKNVENALQLYVLINCLIYLIYLTFSIVFAKRRKECFDATA